MTAPQRRPATFEPPPHQEARQPWLLSYADFISCLLACFVLLFSMVTLDRETFLRILGNVPGRQYTEQDAPQPVDRGMTPDATTGAREATYLLALLQDSFAKEQQLAPLSLTGEGEKVRIALPTAALLDELRSGTAAKPGGLLYTLAGTLRSFPNEILVEGKGVAAAEPERWGNLLQLAQMTALALEQGGISGSVPARTDLAGGGALRVEVVITERNAAETAR
jgi:flagellar motor protein MotB